MAGSPAAATTRPQATQQASLPATMVAQTQAVPAPRRAGGETVAMQATLPSTAPTPGRSAEEHEHRPTGLAMLLAALALMTGIALRRWGAGDQ